MLGMWMSRQVDGPAFHGESSGAPGHLLMHRERLPGWVSPVLFKDLRDLTGYSWIVEDGPDFTPILARVILDVLATQEDGGAIDNHDLSMDPWPARDSNLER